MKPSNRAVECTECGRTVPDSVELCLSCLDEFVDELLSVPGIVADIGTTAALLDRMSTNRNGGKSAETALPIRLDKCDNPPTQSAYAALVDTITTWGRLTSEHYGATIPLGARGLVQLVMTNRASTRTDPVSISLTPCTPAEQVAVWIACNPHTVRALPASHEMIKEVTTAIARARMAVDRLPELKHVGPCKNCGCRLRAEKSNTWVRCPVCNEQYDVQKLLAETLSAADDMVFSTDEIYPLLRAIEEPVKAGTFQSWVSRKKLIPHAWRRLDGRITSYWIHRDDAPLYRLGDVRALRRSAINHPDSPKVSNDL